MKELLGIGSVVECRKIPAHSHTLWEMIYYTRGPVALTLGDRRHVLPAGTFVCQPPGVLHGEEGLDTFDNYFFSVGDRGILPDREIIVSDTINGAIGHQITQMHLIFHTRPVNYRLLCEAHLNTITQYVMSRLGSEWKMNPHVEKYTMALLTRASDSGFRLSDLNGTVPFSPDHFRLLFRQAMGCTPHEYLNRIRIMRARDLLAGRSRGNPLSIADIAAMSGFSDPLYFSRCFRRVTGVAPSQWTAESGLENSVVKEGAE